MSDGFNAFPCCALLHLLFAVTTFGALLLSPPACLLCPAKTAYAYSELHVPIMCTGPSALPCSNWGPMQCDCTLHVAWQVQKFHADNSLSKSMSCCQYKRLFWLGRHLSRARSLPAPGRAHGWCSSIAPWACRPVLAWLLPPDPLIPWLRMRVAASCSAVCHPLQASYA